MDGDQKNSASMIPGTAQIRVDDPESCHHIVYPRDLFMQDTRSNGSETTVVIGLRTTKGMSTCW